MRLLHTFRGYLEAEKADDPTVADDKEWQQAYNSVGEREKVAEKVGFSPDADGCVRGIRVPAEVTLEPDWSCQRDRWYSYAACLSSCSLDMYSPITTHIYPPDHRLHQLPSSPPSPLPALHRPVMQEAEELKSSGGKGRGLLVRRGQALTQKDATADLVRRIGLRWRAKATGRGRARNNAHRCS